MAIAMSRRGQCLSTRYVDVETPLSWKCEAGHVWMAAPRTVRSGSWCPLCAHNQKLKFEEMQDLARERGGRCLSRIYVNSHSALLWECKRGHKWKAMPCNVKDRKWKRGTWSPACFNLRRKFRSRDSIERMQALAPTRGGVCLSKEYINSNGKLLWECERGHQWRATACSVVAGSWCPVCARNQRLKLREFRLLAASKGGRCLSRKYIDKETALRWQCARGHRWSARPGRVKRGTWCARCANLNRRSRWKFSYQDPSNPTSRISPCRI